MISNGKETINSYADVLLQQVENVITDRLKTQNLIIPAIVRSVNTDGTVNVYIPPDVNTTFYGISNQTPFQMADGDSVELLLKKGNYSNCWIFAKHGATLQTTNINSGAVSSAITLGDTTATASDILDGKTAYIASGDKVTGTIQDWAGELVPTTSYSSSDISAENSYVGSISLLNLVYPVGSIYTSSIQEDPSTTIGGTWESLGSTVTSTSITLYVWQRIN